MANRQIQLKYASYNGLSADESSYLRHAGLLLTGLADPPPLDGAVLALSLETPDAQRFELSVTVIGHQAGRGLLLKITEDAAFEALIRYFDAPSYASGVASENLAELSPPEALWVEAEVPPSPELWQPKRPAPGESYPVLQARFPSLRGFLPHVKRLQIFGQISLPFEPVDATTGELSVQLPGRQEYRFWVQIQADPGGVGLLCQAAREDNQLQALLAYPDSMIGQRRLEGEGEAVELEPLLFQGQAEMPSADDRQPLRLRLGRMSMDDKINLALSSNSREERMALAMDGNRAIHPYLLKNRQLSGDEIALMARLASLNPDVIEQIASTPAFVQHPAVVKALVYNPKTAIQTAIRLLDKLPKGELIALSRRNTMRRRLLDAAKKKLGG